MLQKASEILPWFFILFSLFYFILHIIISKFKEKPISWKKFGYGLLVGLGLAIVYSILESLIESKLRAIFTGLAAAVVVSGLSHGERYLGMALYTQLLQGIVPAIKPEAFREISEIEEKEE